MNNHTWKVKLIDKGRVMMVNINAYTQREAREQAEYQYPGYKAMSAQRT